jgi:hypothetical protein
MKSHLPILILFILSMLSVSALDAQTRVNEGDLKSLCQMMSGSFSSEEQARTDSDFFDIRLHMKRIWPERKR